MTRIKQRIEAESTAARSVRTKRRKAYREFERVPSRTRTKAIQAVAKYSSTRGTDRTLLLTIAIFAGDSLVAYPSIPDLACFLGIDERATRKAIKRLESNGEIIVERTNGGRNLRNQYVLNLGPTRSVKVVKKRGGNPVPAYEGFETLSQLVQGQDS